MPDAVARHVYRPGWIYSAADHTPPGPCAECHANLDAPQHYTAPVELSEQGRAWLESIRDADRQLAAITDTIIRPLADKRDTAIRNLQAILADSEAATVGGRPVLLWAWRKPAAGFDLDALRRDHPEIAAAYAKNKKAARPFNVVEVEG